MEELDPANQLKANGYRCGGAGHGDIAKNKCGYDNELRAHRLPDRWRW
jgi:hypothetical protein